MERYGRMARMETCGVFLSGSKQPGNNHTLSGIPDAKIFHVMDLNERFALNKTGCVNIFNLFMELV